MTHFVQPIIRKLRRLDRGSFTDPWGFGFEIEVLRTGHPDWKQWQKENLAEVDDLMDEASDIVARKLEKQAQNGQRRRKAPSQAKLRKMIRAEYRRLRKARGASLDDAEQKTRQGIARVLLVRLSNGEAEASEAERLEMLRDRPDNEIPERIEEWPESLGEYRGEIDEDGEIPYGDQSFGNAFRDWILDCADSLEEHRGDELEDAAKNSPRPPAGESATGAA